MKNRVAAVLLIAGLAIVASVQAQDAAPTAGANEYTIGPRDVLEIHCLELQELNLERRVSDNGTIDLPLLGQVQAAGSTATDVRQRIADGLTKYVNQPNVLVSVKEFNNKPVSVFGAVLKPGSLSISGKWTLMQAISAAGGLSDKAGRRILVLRRADNGLSDTLEIDTEDLFQNATELWNIPILPADVINIPPRQSFTIFCLGAVRNAGAIQFETTDRVTLLSLVAKAGGLSDRASKKIRIKRRAPDGKDVEQIVDFGKVLAGEIDDPVLQANDVIFVKESFF
jgi:polysaccharide export outer membrane protein